VERRHFVRTLTEGAFSAIALQGSTWNIKGAFPSPQRVPRGTEMIEFHSSQTFHVKQVASPTHFC